MSNRLVVINSDFFSLCSHRITLRSYTLCCFISTESLPGPPHRHCCLPVLQWCHRPWLCHHGDLQACTNKAWEVHTGELIFFLYLRGLSEGRSGQEEEESRCSTSFKVCQISEMNERCTERPTSMKELSVLSWASGHTPVNDTTAGFDS